MTREQYFNTIESILHGIGKTRELSKRDWLLGYMWHIHEGHFCENDAPFDRFYDAMQELSLMAQNDYINGLVLEHRSHSGAYSIESDIYEV